MVESIRRGYRNGRTDRHADPPQKTSFWNHVAQGLGYFYAVRESAAVYLEQHARRLRTRSKRIADEAARKLLELIAVGTVVATSIVLALRGIAGGLTEAMGGRAWAGDLITAAVVAAAGIISWAVLRAGRPRRRHDVDECDDL
jgi:hypothetical protein